jgi:ABC-type Fe3+/spermidine/putrescine transport system ATPase subunit
MSTRLEGRVTGQEGEFVTIETPVGTLRALASKDFSAGSQVLVAVRPENFAIGLPERDDMNAMRCQIGEQAFLGSKTQLYLNVPSGSFALAEVNPSVASKHRQGDWIDLNWPVKNTLLYPLQEGTNTLGAS